MVEMLTNFIATVFLLLTIHLIVSVHDLPPSKWRSLANVTAGAFSAVFAMVIRG